MLEKLFKKIRYMIAGYFVVKAQEMLRGAMCCYAKYPKGSIVYQYGPFYEALADFYIEIAEAIYGSNLTSGCTTDPPSASSERAENSNSAGV